MIKGNIDLSWLDERDLYTTKFLEETNTIWCSGYWKDMGLPVPDYPYESTTVLQTYDEHAPAWANKIKEQFDWLDLKMVTLNCLKPGRIIPPHRDMFFRVLNHAKDIDYPVEDKRAIRVNIFLQDFMMGHFLQVGDTVYSNYNRGDYVFIEHGVVHTVSNTSNHNRYTLQVTGFLND